MIINIRSKQFDSVTILLIYDSRFYASTYDCPNHCLLTMVIVAGRKFALVKQTLNPIIKQWVTLQQWWHCCSCSSIMSCMSALQPAGSSHGWIIAAFSSLAAYMSPSAMMKANQQAGSFLAGLSLMSSYPTSNVSAFFGSKLLLWSYGR